MIMSNWSACNAIGREQLLPAGKEVVGGLLSERSSDAVHNLTYSDRTDKMALMYIRGPDRRHLHRRWSTPNNSVSDSSADRIPSDDHI